MRNNIFHLLICVKHFGNIYSTIRVSIYLKEYAQLRQRSGRWHVVEQRRLA